ncbi:MAG: hypothetical protein HYX69_09525 [Planctomycetia bacterium]|nr:hypothetical protein [Planctomycetia bacterium]
MRSLVLTTVCLLAIAPTARAITLLQDDFESGVSGDISYNGNINDKSNGVYTGTWHPWSGPSSTLYQQVLITNDSHNHTPGQPGSPGGPPSLGGQGYPGAAWAADADPYGYSAYANLGGTIGGLHAEVWAYSDANQPAGKIGQYGGTGANWPIREMFALLGADSHASDPIPFPGFSKPNYPASLYPYDTTPLSQIAQTGQPGGTLADFVQIGIDPTWAGTQNLNTTNPTFNYSFRTAYDQTNGIGTNNGSGNYSTDTGVARAAGWTKFTIDASPTLVDGGDGLIKLSINDVLVGTSQRTGAPLQFVMMGQNQKNYQPIWYDDVKVDFVPGVDPDANGDGIVDISDIQTVAAKWLQTGVPAFAGDANNDGIVDISDIQTIAAHWLQAWPPAPIGAAVGVPEPSSMVTLSMGILALAAWRLLSRRSSPAHGGAS